MYKITIILFIIFSTLFNTACTFEQNKSQGSVVEINSPSISKDEVKLEDNPNEDKQVKKGYSTIEIPITLMGNDIKEDKQIKYLQIEKNTTLEEKVNKIVSVVSSECFSNLPIKVKIYGNDTAKVDLLEFNKDENNRVSWKEDYLNNSTREQTLRVLLENILQDEYNGQWIEKVQLYYEGELLSLD
ncbi:MAG: hypothetical protein IJH55_03975 [Romboutsia sp.]|nr:hypothetical protein [Romboutsia sp.]